VDDQVIVELKAVNQLPAVVSALLNFGKARLADGIKRFVV
jgi:hypothetical protein